MHELGLCDGVVEAIRGRAKGRPVSWARIRIGGHPVDPSVIADGVAMAAAGTEAEGLVLEVLLDPMRARCRSCGAEHPISQATHLVACTSCGGIDIELTGSEHAVLEAVGYRQGEGDEGSWTPSNS